MPQVVRRISAALPRIVQVLAGAKTDLEKLQSQYIDSFSTKARKTILEVVLVLDDLVGAANEAG